MKKIVLTGATSMIGIALIEECIKNDVEVLGFARKNSLNLKRIPKSKLVKIVECDIEQLQNVKDLDCKYDVFYHFAWNSTSIEYRNDVRFQSKNIKYTLDAVELAKKLGCHTFILAGSQAEYGTTKEKIISSNTVTNPETAYGVAKYSAGKLSKIMCKSMGINHIWTRVFSVYGYNDKKNTMVMYAIDKFFKKEKPLFTKAEQQWDYIYSVDAARAFFLLGIKGKSESIYCIASGVSRPLYEYIHLIRYNIDSKLPLGIGEKACNDNQAINLCVDISKLIEDTGFKPKYSFELGIKETIEYLKESKLIVP